MGLVVAVGGDGTHNEVLAGFLDGEGRNRFPGAQLGLVGAGTGGDFLRYRGPWGLDAQIEAVVRDEWEAVDYGVARFVRADGAPVVRPFLNVASVGITGLVDALIESGPRIPPVVPMAKYMVGALRGIARYRNVDVELRVDGGPAEWLPLTVLAACNGQFFGGGMHVAPAARCDDGVLDLVWAAGLGRLRLVNLLRKLVPGKHLGAPEVQHVRGQRVEITPRVEGTLLLDLDGEQPGHMPGSLEVVPGGIRLRG